MSPPTASRARAMAAFGVALQCLMLGALIAGALTGRAALSQAAAVLALLWLGTQWTRLIPLARLFAALAAAGALLLVPLLPGAGPKLATALVQGTGFAALMMVLGLLRQPVKRAEVTRRAAAYLLSEPPRRRYGAMLAGAQFMALMFNVGIIAMIGDLTRTAHGPDPGRDPARRAMVMAAMRGAALVTIWSPLSLGFAIVTTGVPAIEPLQLVAVAAGFTLLLLGLLGLWPMLPAEARIPAAAGPAATGSARALASMLGASALLLALTLGLHALSGLSFTLAAVIVLPAFSLGWLLLEPARGQSLGQRLGGALLATADLRSESALFLSANVIGAALSLAIQASPLWPVISGAGFASLPALLACLAAIPLAAALYLPNSVMVVLAAQIFGPTLLGQEHPLALGLTLCIGWAVAICVNPISAMSLIAGRLCDVPPARIAHAWNRKQALAILALAALLVSLVYACGG
ncbi:hypothetical protein [Poseidonocella sp. HB161398]|uniref:hypothetical protein n=1 Tax=Poseidonocella sp. HB161398 TaxID=2320855 RepID=UPI001109119E|nr:hypothetical protein [Poseidonocella sp. HB161398]